MISIKGIIGEQYSAVQFLADLINETGPVVEIDINSPGGYVIDGFQIYRAIQSVKSQGKRVRTSCHGECASIATIIFIAGDDRIAGCPIMIHNPWVAVEGDASTLEQMAKDVKAVEKEMETIYLENSKLTLEQISDIMDNETVLSQAQAVAIGLATQAETKAVALLIIDKLNTNKNKDQMAKKELSVWQKALKALGKDQPEIKNLSIDTQEGTPLVLEKEEGDPMEGDVVVSPTDGVVTLMDGSVVTIVEGVITSIAAPAPAALDPNAIEPATVEEAVSVLEEVLTQLEEAQALAKTPEEVQILNAVKAAGGIQALIKKAGIQSKYTPATRTNEAGAGKGTPAVKAVGASGSSALDSKLAAAREKAKSKIK